MPSYLLNIWLKDWIEAFLFLIFCIVCWNVADKMLVFTCLLLHVVCKCLSLTGFHSIWDFSSPFFLIKATPAWNYGQHDQNIKLSLLWLSNYIHCFLRCWLHLFSLRVWLMRSCPYHKLFRHSRIRLLSRFTYLQLMVLWLFWDNLQKAVTNHTCSDLLHCRKIMIIISFISISITVLFLWDEIVGIVFNPQPEELGEWLVWTLPFDLCSIVRPASNRDSRHMTNRSVIYCNYFSIKTHMYEYISYIQFILHSNILL